jgi:hypothetical protein
MTFRTFAIGVTILQGKETVIKSCTGPLKGINRMTCRTIFLETGLNMVWLCGGRVVLPVTVDAIDSDDIKPYRVF